MTRFYQYEDCYAAVKQHTDEDPKEFYERALRMHREHGQINAYVSMFWEIHWREARRPYYRVYPKICDALTRVNLDRVICTSVKPPSGQTSLIINMPHGNKLLDDGRDIQHLLLEFDAVHNEQGRLLTIGVHYGERFGQEVCPGGVPGWDVWYFRIEIDSTVGEEMHHVSEAWTSSLSKDSFRQLGYHVVSTAEQRRATALALSLSMLGEDSDLVRPEVLSDDERRASIANREALANKARRRGKVGWSVGAGVEVSPHIRVPHPALYHVGPGRKEQVILFRAGSVVHRSKIEQVPTGYHDEESGDGV